MTQLYFNEYTTIINYIKEYASNHSPLCISIDGMCGSGKTTFSEKLEKELQANLVHIDHFYLPKKLRSEDWFEKIAGNMDLNRFKSSVLIPFIEKKDIYYQRFNQFQQELLDGYDIVYKPILIVDGSYSQHKELRDYYQLKVFMTCSKESQLSRLEKRENLNMKNFVSTWIPKENKYFETMKIQENADVVFDTTGLF